MSRSSKGINRYSRREFFKGVAGVGAGAVAVGLLGGRGVKTVSAQLERPKKIKVLIEDLRESGLNAFNRGRARGISITGSAGNAALRSDGGGEFESGTLELPFPATHVGLHWKVEDAFPGDIDVSIRSSGNGADWSPWRATSIEAVADLKDPHGSIPVHGHLDPDSTGTQPGDYEIFASLVGVDRPRYLQYRLTFPQHRPAHVEEVTATVINATDGPREMMATSAPTNMTLENDAGIQIGLITRESWGADESLRFNSNGDKIWREMYVPTKKVFLHHTATSNTYSDGAAEVRAIYTYHAQTLGWGDIGYNLLVDRFGTIYEGRHGRGEASLGEREPLSSDVVAGHVFAYNYGTTGIAAIGNSQQGTWNRSWDDTGLQALEDAVAFECGRHYLDPEGASHFLRSDRVWHVGELLHCVGHRDADGSGGSTACPGDRLYSYLNETLRPAVASRLDGANATANLTGSRSGNTLRFDWDDDADGYWYSFEGCWKEANETAIDYLTEYAEDSGYPDIDSEPMRWVWAKTSNASKEFEITQPGHYTMHVRSASASFVYAAHQTLLVEEIEDIEEPVTGTISGTVTDTEDNPIGGATVEVSGEDLFATTDGDGFYTLENVPTGEYTMVASADGYESQSQDVVVLEDDHIEVDFALAAEEEVLATTMHVAALIGSSSRQGPTWVATVEIRIVDDTGEPVTGATVTGDWSGGYQEQGVVADPTDEGGWSATESGAIPNRNSSTSFSVAGVEHSFLEYDSDNNEQTSVTVVR